MLRQMSAADLQEVNLLLSKAFTHGYLEDGLRNRRVPLCKLSFLEYYQLAEPEGAYVIEETGRLVAYCFSRCWGSVGWLGPLSVLPEETGKGYGKEIVTTGIEYLKRSGVQTIGLEMAAVSGRNLAFYTKLGFQVDAPTVDCVRPVAATTRTGENNDFEVVRLSRIAAAERPALLSAIRQFSARFQPALDYSDEITRCLYFGFGDAILLLDNGQIIALMIAHTETYSAEEKRQFLKVNILQISPGLPIQIIDSCIDILERWAREEDLRALYVRVPTRYTGAFRYLLQNSFQIAQNDLRLTLKGFELLDKSDMINFSKWE